ncbi:hypothetical protein EC973_002931 [Apophysomyces ossiformis]|uniref:C2H2-type domain-containing protein n=1 Tax=Apophysomyces ossiformis TaxID=679940 RepID=A0A8H7BM89_9FUNG|nr:hypothetical protein EC973_002931 [Apophysomyces ossiformis]
MSEASSMEIHTPEILSIPDTTPPLPSYTSAIHTDTISPTPTSALYLHTPTDTTPFIKEEGPIWTPYTDDNVQYDLNVSPENTTDGTRSDRCHTVSVACYAPKSTSRPLGDTGGKIPRKQPMPIKKKDALSLFSHLSKEELIRRVVELENQKRMSHLKSQVPAATPPSPVPSEPEEEEEQKFPCHWANCHLKWSTLDQLMTHLRDEHIGSGKVHKLT